MMMVMMMVKMLVAVMMLVMMVKMGINDDDVDNGHSIGNNHCAI